MRSGQFTKNDTPPKTRAKRGHATFRLFLLFLLLLPVRVSRADTDLDRYYALKQQIASVNDALGKNMRSTAAINTRSAHIFWPSDTQSTLDRLHAENSALTQRRNRAVAEMRELENRISATVIIFRLGKLKEVQQLLSTAKRDCVAGVDDAKSPVFFENNETFERWYSLHHEVEKKAFYYARQNKYISDCIDGPAIPEGKTLKVSGYSSHVCQKFKHFNYNSVSELDYTLTKKKRADRGRPGYLLQLQG